MVNVYLGRRVKDRGEEGIDSLEELNGIINAIIKDVRDRRIDCQLGAKRMGLLYLISKRVFLTRRKAPLEYAMARRMIDAGMHTLRQICPQR